MADLLIETQQEMRKVAWSSRAEVIGSTIVVLVTVVLLSLFIFVTDSILLALAGVFGVY
ncbi:MAG TPA: preprotein translocase subunit SecE [Planctomycetota bacterium]|nr:preprotein translocase subunit SecE [Planctomycetota bacterium]HRR80322.1 preprotein translocase subunit SecE [Planctomycetota bacterium]HRT94128.1 preprotein translocase subunit SecE [Planctomycetota bacterium]